MLNIQIEITGDKETIAKLQKMDKSFGDWTPELRQVGEFLKQFYSIAAFETEGGIFGARWAALNPSYERWKRDAFPGKGILVRTGDMKKGYKYEATNNSMTLWNVSKYAIFHQTGTKRMPQRLLVSLKPKQRDEIINIFKRGLAQRIQKAL
jgi:phage gpG-like protein